MLRAIGVAEFDERAYKLLLRHPDATHAELATLLGATPRRVAAAMTRLVQLGLIRRAGAGRHTPNDPEPALAALLQRREAELNGVRSTVSDLAGEFHTGRLRAQPARLVEVVTGPAEIYRRTMELYQAATREVLAFERPPYAVPADFDEIAAERPILERGVTLRIIYSGDALELPRKIDTVRALAALGERARTLPSLPLKLLVFDGSTARVSLASDASATESVAIIHASGLLDALIALFEAYWERAHPIAAADEAQSLAGLTPEEARVLAMLGAGFKDEAIARHMGVSMRTTGRRILSIHHQLQASTRFQAGAAAVRRGWL